MNTQPFEFIRRDAKRANGCTIACDLIDIQVDIQGQADAIRTQYGARYSDEISFFANRRQPDDGSTAEQQAAWLAMAARAALKAQGLLMAESSGGIPGTLVRELRESAGLTLAQAAEMVHAHPQTWVKWERGERQMHAAFWELACLKVAATPPEQPGRTRASRG